MRLAIRTMLAHVSWSGAKLLGMCYEAGGFTLRVQFVHIAATIGTPVGQVVTGWQNLRRLHKAKPVAHLSLQPSFVLSHVSSRSATVRI